jgi:hypothetical protein
METDEALEIVMDIAARWGENAEEAFTRRVMSTDTDEDCAGIAAMPDGTVDETGLKDVKTVRNLWRALDVLHMLRKQDGEQ